ncbi:hypothetical protein DFS34DRAFT_72944 [Phlyctochytrium arcticum]|nr:hypothetical protein DFS34DRAFT_72944 [Phlyctochytrium arcticum]
MPRATTPKAPRTAIAKSPRKTATKDLPADANYLLRVELLTRWTVVRFISVPPTITFHDLHKILQIAFEWNNSHLYKFEIQDGPPVTKSKRPASTVA